MDTLELAGRLGLSFALGLLIGIERGWHERTEREGARVAGARSFALSGFLGGLASALAEDFGGAVLATAFLAHAGLMILFRLRAARAQEDFGSTTTIAAMVTFALGALAVRGPVEAAAAGAALTALLLGIKPALHGWLARIEYGELMATLKLLAMSVVLLPVLPDRGFGPWAALNPYELWWMVVLVAGLSYAGYLAIRLAGGRAGVVLGALAGGLVSSTAVTASLARRAHGAPESAALLAGGAAIASATMYPRVAVILAVAAPQLLAAVAPALLAAGAFGYALAAIALRRGAGDGKHGIEARNPFEFAVALRFGALLAAVILLSHAIEEWAGRQGLYALAALAGLTDVDALALSVARMVGPGGLGAHEAVAAVILAASANTLAKTAFAWQLGSARFAVRLALLTWPGAALAAGLYAFA